MSLIAIENVTKIYDGGPLQVEAIKDINLTIEEGEFTSVAGPSGLGKTTLLNLIGCLDKSTRGTLRIEGQDISELDTNDLAQLRSERIGFVFQTFNLAPCSLPLRAWNSL